MGSANCRAKNPARVSLHCALRMLDELNALARRDARFEDLEIGIGVATGEVVVVGNRGGKRHISYSVTGDTVNLASRPWKDSPGISKVRFSSIATRSTRQGRDSLAVRSGWCRCKGKIRQCRWSRWWGATETRSTSHTTGALPRCSESERRGGLSPVDSLRALLQERPEDEVARMHLNRLEAIGSESPREIVFRFDKK